MALVRDAWHKTLIVWGESRAGRHILIAMARYVATHSPTERAQFQTAMVERCLSLG